MTYKYKFLGQQQVKDPTRLTLFYAILTNGPISSMNLLNPPIVSIVDTFPFKLFQSLTTLCVKKDCLSNNLDRTLSNLSPCPLVLSFKLKSHNFLTLSNPLIILNVSMRSPLLLRFSREYMFKQLKRSP